MLKLQPPLIKAMLCTALLSAAWTGSITAQELAGSPPSPRLSALANKAGLNTAWRESVERAISRAINPDDYECGPTEFDAWIGDELGKVGDLDAFFEILFEHGAIDWAAFHTILFDQNASDESIGVSGSYTKQLKQRHKDNQNFWTVPTQDVLLQAMHGSVLADDSKMIPVVQILFGESAAEAAARVNYVQSVIESVAGIGYGNPIFTLNAFAFAQWDEPPGSPFAGVPDKIVMGDGIIKALQDFGLGANGPDVVHAHEFAHHVQIELGIFNDPVPEPEQPEFTRMTELMADGFGSYFSAHARGAAFQTGKIIDTLRSFYVVGDCFFDSPGHHGTPNQREAASRWGVELAKGALNQGKINSAAQMLELFQAELPALLAPDAP